MKKSKIIKAINDSHSRNPYAHTVRGAMDVVVRAKGILVAAREHEVLPDDMGRYSHVNYYFVTEGGQAYPVDEPFSWDCPRCGCPADGVIVRGRLVCETCVEEDARRQATYDKQFAADTREMALVVVGLLGERLESYKKSLAELPFPVANAGRHDELSKAISDTEALIGKWKAEAEGTAVQPFEGLLST